MQPAARRLHAAAQGLQRGGASRSAARPALSGRSAVLQRVVAAAFNQRRKMLRAALKGLRPDIEDRLIAAGIAPTQRAETVTLEQFCALARSLHAA